MLAIFILFEYSLVIIVIKTISKNQWKASCCDMRFEGIYII